MKKTIYFWSPHLTNVGTVKSVLNSALAFAKFANEKYSVKMIDVFGEWCDYKDVLKENNIEKINLTFNYQNFLPKYGFIASRFSYTVIILVSFFPLLLLLIKRKPDYLIVHLLTSLPLFLFKFLRLKSKIILRISGKPKLNFLRKLLWRSLKDVIFRITCPTKELVSELNKNETFISNKIFFLPDPIIDIKEYLIKKNLKPTSYKFENKPFLLCVGRLTKQKNYNYLINEYKKFTKNNDKYDLVIIGDGEEKKQIEYKIKKNNLEEKIYLIGYEDNFYFYMNKASAFILPSLWEELGLAIVQAATSNTVIISSDCPHGPKEFLNNGETGVLFSNNKNDALYKSLHFFSDNENDLRRKRIIAKKNSLHYTKFRHHQTFLKIINS